MGEFQCVYFAAIDRPLSNEELAYMQEQSTRAEITKREFRNEYHYGSFRGNTMEMLRRGFDVHLYYSEYGVRNVLFRLPYGLPVDLAVLERYFVKGEVDWDKDKSGSGGILSIRPQCDGEDYDEYRGGCEEAIEALADARQALMDGDLRLFYLAWLACMHDENEKEPPLPAGLGELEKPFLDLAYFLGIPSELVAAAAIESPPLNQSKAMKTANAKAWVKSQSKEALQTLAVQLLEDKSGEVRSQALAAIRQSLPRFEWPTVNTNRTFGQLGLMAEEIEKFKLAEEQSKAQTKRKKQLAELAANPTKVINAATARIQVGKHSDYDTTAQELADLCEALGPELGPATVFPVASKIVLQFPHRKSLKTAFESRGLLPKRAQRAGK